MRFIWLDSGLNTNLGHHAQSCRAILGEVRKRGIETHAYGFVLVEDAIQSELGVKPLLRWHTYNTRGDDPICGWLQAFTIGSEITAQDLGRLETTEEDVVYFNTAQPIQLFGIIKWMLSTPPGRLPHVIVEFGCGPGLIRLPDGNLSIMDPRQDGSAILYRFCALAVDESIKSKLSLVTFDKTCSEGFSKLMGLPVQTLPVPREAVGPIRSRVGANPITVSFLGHQRLEKAIHLLPDICRQLLAKHKNIRVLVHNGDVAHTLPFQKELRIIAETEPRLVLDERVADDKLWADLLNQSDLIVLPYSPEAFQFRYSAVACEAVANGIPLVVPQGTAIENMVNELTYTTSATGTFSKWTPEAVVYEVSQILANFEGWATNAFLASSLWEDQHGPCNTVDRMLALAGVGEPDKMTAFAGFSC